MGLPRSTYYDAPPVKTDDAEIVANITAICDEFEAYGYRRVGAELRHRGMVVNSKKIRRLMREHDLQPKRRRRFVASTDSDHDNPIFPDLARDRIVDGPNQLWVADITYIAIATGFVYLAAILDAWSRRVVGYAISRSIDARVAVAALKAAIRVRQPPKGCIHHSDRGSQYASEPIATCWPNMVSSALWADAGNALTMPRPRALWRPLRSGRLFARTANLSEDSPPNFHALSMRSADRNYSALG